MPESLKAFACECKGKWGYSYLVVFAETPDKAVEIAEASLIERSLGESRKDIYNITELDPAVSKSWLLNDGDF